MSVPAVVFVLCAAACVVAHVAILLSTVSARARATAAADVPRPRAAVELVWALVPVVALAIVLTATWASIQERREPRPTMRVAQ